MVIGAGAAGLVAAERASSRGRKTLLLERNRKPGIKILMSGGTRCNLTQNTDGRGIVAAYGPPGRFLHSALAALGPQDLVALVEAEGVPTKVEETGKIFPVSNKAADVLQAFLDRLYRSGCELALDESLVELERIENLRAENSIAVQHRFRLATSKRTITAGCVIITTGGQSYPASGTTGDGYRWAAALGHTIVPPRPALVPITTSAPWVRNFRASQFPMWQFACCKVVSLYLRERAGVRVPLLNRPNPRFSTRAAVRSCSPILACPGRWCSISAATSAGILNRKRCNWSAIFCPTSNPPI